MKEGQYTWCAVLSLRFGHSASSSRKHWPTCRAIVTLVIYAYKVTHWEEGVVAPGVLVKNKRLLARVLRRRLHGISNVMGIDANLPCPVGTLGKTCSCRGCARPPRAS